MRKLAAVIVAFTLLGALAGCGKGSKGTAPAPSAAAGPKSREEAMPIAKQSAQMAASYVEQVKSLIGVATVPGTRPARVRPLGVQRTAADSSSWTYEFQGYDASGAPIDYVTQSGQLASLGMDWIWYYRTTSDSLLLEYDVRSHSRVDGFLAGATRYVVNDTDTSHVAYDAQTSGYHMAYVYDGRWNFANVAWEKSGTPTYPVAGSIAIRWHYVYEYTSGNQHATGNIEVDGTITFNGTRYATAVIGGYTFTIDLESGTVS